MSTFWEIIASNALLVAILAAILILLGRIWKHPASLHLLWVLLLLKLFIPPVYTVGIPAVSRSETAAKPAPIATPKALPAMDKATNATDGELPWSVTYGASPDSTTVTASAHNIEQVVAQPTFTAEVVTGTRWAVPSWSVLLLWGWGIGTVLLAVGCVLRVMAFRRLLRSAEPPNEELREMATRIAKRLGLRRVPDFLIVSVRLSPMVWALSGRARVVLPKNLVEQLGEAGREAILAHELAHVRRCDHLVRWIELLAALVFWWHPVVWWARRELRELEEQCCDGMVLDVLPDACKSYAVSLVETLDFLSETSFIKPLAATGAKPGASLARRIAMLKNRGSVGVKLTVGRVLLLCAVAAVPMALALASEPLQPAEMNLPTADAAGVVTPSPIPAKRAAISDRAPAETPIVPTEAEPLPNPVLPPPNLPEAVAPLEPKPAPPRNTAFSDLATPAASAQPAQKPRSLPARVNVNTAFADSNTLKLTQSSSPTRKRAIFRLNNAPASDVAETIRALYEGEIKANPSSRSASDVVISADTVSNCILVSASEEEVSQIEEFIKTLDAPKSMVRVEMLVAQIKAAVTAATESQGKSTTEYSSPADARKRILDLGSSSSENSEEFAAVLAELRDREELDILSRPQIMTLDNQPAFVQVGEALVGAAGGLAPGMTLGITPTVADEMVLMEVDFKITRDESAGQAVLATGVESTDGTKVPVRRLVTTMAEATISVADGRTVVLGGLMPNADSQDEELIVILTPHIVTQGPSPVAGRVPHPATFLGSSRHAQPQPQMPLPGPAAPLAPENPTPNSAWQSLPPILEPPK